MTIKNNVATRESNDNINHKNVVIISKMTYNIFLRSILKRRRCFIIFDTWDFLDHILALRRISFFTLYLFSADVCPMPSVMLCYICRIKAKTFHEYISRYNSIAVLKNGIHNTVFCSVGNQKPVKLSKVRWIHMKY